MPHSPAVHWLSEQMRTGVRELPSNAAWVVSQVVQPVERVGSAAGHTTAEARTRGRRIRAAVVNGDDPVDLQLARAREAAERAREAESTPSRQRRRRRSARARRSG